MKPKSNYLCIFEGESREGRYFKSLEDVYFDNQSILTCSFNNDFYELFEMLKADEDLDIVELVRESASAPENINLLKGYERDDFSQVFLFFDIECQDDKYSPETFLELIDIFDEETENGKVFISYPMVEAIRDIPSYDAYLDHKVSVCDCSAKPYKELSALGLQTFNDPRNKEKSDWDKLVRLSVEKGNFIASGFKGNLSDIPDQKDIAIGQVRSILEDDSMFVLSSFPLFVYHQKFDSLTL